MTTGQEAMPPVEKTTGPSEEDVLALLRAAGSLEGLNVLLMLAEDPALCETTEGFALRLRCTPREVRNAIQSLHDGGVLSASPGPVNRNCVSYWLPPDRGLMAAIRGLVDMYASGSTGRNNIMQALQAG